jgi:hypothetical protein
MGLIAYSKVDRDFAGGIYLPPLGLSLTDLLQSAAIHDDAQCVIDGSSMAGTTGIIYCPVIAEGFTIGLTYVSY